MIDKQVFGDLQAKIDDDSSTRELIREVVQELEREGNRNIEFECWTLTDMDMESSKNCDVSIV